IFYANETHLSPDSNPHVVLKPDPCPETVRHQPHLLGILEVRTDYLRSHGVHPSYEGALLPELCLRALDEGQGVTHLRRVLLHHAADQAAPLYSPKVLHRLAVE